MSERRDDDPVTDEIEEPSTEKSPDEEPKASAPHDPDPDHEAVGIGIVGGNDLADPDRSDDHDD